MCKDMFLSWCDDVDAIFRSEFGFTLSYTRQCGREFFRDGFLGGYSPRDAVYEEVGYWDPA